jgi:hypothetical protein
VRSFIAIAAALLASLTLAACSGGDSVSLESVANAATRTESAGSSRMALVMTMDVGGKRFDVLAEGAFDYKRSRGWMDMDLGALGSVSGGRPLGGPIRMLVDGDTFFMRVPPAMRSETGGKPWAKLGSATSAFGGAGMQNPDPSSMLDSLRGVTDELEKRGRVRVRGVSTTHYHAKVDMSKAFAEVPAAEREQLEKMMKLLGGSVDVPIDVYIDDADRIRRMDMTYQFNAVGQTMSVALKMELFDFGTRVAFKRPPATEVAELSSLAGAGG